MDGLEDERLRYDHFAALWAFAAFESCKILITGRPELFLDDAELRRNLAIHPEATTGPYTRLAYLQRFNSRQIRDALRNVEPLVVSEIIELGLADRSFFDIISRPSLLHQVASIWNDPILQYNKNNMNSAFVIQLFLDSTFRRQAEKVRADSNLQFMKLNQSELAFFTKAIAIYMARERCHNQITSAQLQFAIRIVWQAVGTEFIFPSRPEIGEQMAAIKQRLKDSADPIETVVTNVRSYGVLVRDYSRSDTFKFSHKSYYELLVGSAAAEMVNLSKEEQHRLLMNAFYPTFNDLLVSPVAAAFCGESMRIKGGTARSTSEVMNRIYDFVLRTGWISRAIPRAVHRLLAIRVPSFLVARRLAKPQMRRVSLRSSIRAATLFYRVAGSLGPLLVYLIAYYVWSHFRPASESLWFFFTEFSAFVGGLLLLQAIAMSGVRAAVFGENRGAILHDLSVAATGEATVREYYGKSFCSIVNLLRRWMDDSSG